MISDSVSPLYTVDNICYRKVRWARRCFWSDGPEVCSQGFLYISWACFWCGPWSLFPMSSCGSSLGQRPSPIHNRSICLLFWEVKQIIRLDLSCSCHWPQWWRMIMTPLNSYGFYPIVSVSLLWEYWEGSWELLLGMLSWNVSTVVLIFNLI